MSTRFARPTALYNSTSVTTNMLKYRTDSDAVPKIAISSVKVDGDINYAIDALNALDDDVQGLVVGSVPDGSITTNKLANLAVTTAKIADLNVTTGKIALLAVDSTLLAANAVTTAKILDANVTDTKIANAAVTVNKLGAGAVTLVKMENRGANTLLGNPTNTSAMPSEFAVNSSSLVGRGATGDITNVTPGIGLAFSGATVVSLGLMEFVDTTTLSAQATSVHSLAFGTNYLGMRFDLHAVLPSADATFRMEISQDGGSTYLASTDNVYVNHSGAGSADATVSAATTTFALSLASVESTTSPAYGVGGNITLYQLSTSKTTVIANMSYVDATGQIRFYRVTGFFNTTAAATHIRFSYSTGNLASGIIVKSKIRK